MPETAALPKTSETNVDRMKRWYKEAWEQRRPETILELLAPDGVLHGTSESGSDIRGANEFLAFYERITASFSDIKFTVHATLEAGDIVVARWSATMQHTGDKLGFKATGRPIAVNGISMVRFVNGQVVEGWDNWDQLGMLRQIGAVQLAASSNA